MTIEAHFYRGNYGRILAETVDSPGGVIPPEAAGFVIGALTFRGRLDEAESTYRLFQGEIDAVTGFVARFFLGINLCRHSHYARGRRYLAQNLREGVRHPCAKVRFYVWQGAGFYRLVGCRYQDSLRYASLALNAALEANFLYGKALASDLMAHSQVGPGQIQAAGESFRRALGYAELLGDGGLRQAIQVSLAIHSATHGLDAQDDVARLEAVAAELTSEDNYSKSRLLLELGRQHLLRGRKSRAKAALDEACRLVYGSQNRRYGIILNMRYAALMRLEGEHLQALNLVRNAAKALDPFVDKTVATEVRGLELVLLQRVPCPTLDSERERTQKELAELTRFTGRAVSQRMLSRDVFRGYNGQALMGDDPLGDLVDLSVSRSESAVRRIVESGYLQLLMSKLAIAPGTAGLLVDLLPGALLAYDSGELHLVPSGVSQVFRTLLKSLAAGHGTKEELIREIWGYKYNPLKHDQLIYTAVSRLRQLLGPFAGWIEVTEAGYALRSGLTAGFLGGALHVVATAKAEEPQSDVLNYRQLGIVEHLKDESFCDARTISQKFSVSEVSARRDLAHLTNLGVLVRHGKGRATRYSMRGLA